MSNPRSLGPAAVAGGTTAAGSLPVTGNSTMSLIIIGVTMIVMGLLLFRSSRVHRPNS